MHYTVGVLTKHKPWDFTIEKMLEPYDENKEVEPYIVTREEIIEQERKWHPELSDEELYQRGISDIPEGRRVPDGKGYISTYNKDSQWDWWSYGGRWQGSLQVRYDSPTMLGLYEDEDREPTDGAVYEVDQARIKDILNRYDEDTYQDCLREWELYVEDAEPQDDRERRIKERQFYNKDYYLERYKTKEFYAKYSACFTTYAILTTYGGWESLGKIGWFGDEQEDGASERWLKRWNDIFDNADENDWLTVIDCHI